ncbi:MAG: cyclodeaminase/cyclohydrolase family protein [Flavobacteriales bacterium]
MPEKQQLLKQQRAQQWFPTALWSARLTAWRLCWEMAKTGLPASISDAGVGAMRALTAVRGAHLNVRVNVKDMDDQTFCQQHPRESRRTQSKQ